MRKFLILAAAAFALVACGKDPNGGGGTNPVDPDNSDYIDPNVVYKTSGDLFGKNYVAKGTVFTRRVDKEMPLAPNSAAIAAKMKSLAMNPYGVITTITRQHYNYTIIIVDSNDKNQHYANFIPEGHRERDDADLYKYTGGRQPIVHDAKPAAGNDAHMAVYDVATGVMRQYFGVTYVNSGEYKFKGSGYFIAKPGLRGLAKDNYWMRLTKGGSSVVGMLNPLSQIGIEEVRAGEINHALSFTIAHARKGFSWPAKAGDGDLDDADAPMEGQWCRIDPKVDLDKLGLSPMTLMIAKAVQKYGAYAADKNAFCHTFTTEHGIYELAIHGLDPWEHDGEFEKKYGKFPDLNDFPWELTQWAPVDWGKPTE